MEFLKGQGFFKIMKPPGVDVFMEAQEKGFFPRYLFVLAGITGGDPKRS